MNSEWSHLDKQLKNIATYLRNDLEIAPPESEKLATQIASDLGQMDAKDFDWIISEDIITPQARYDELIAFQQFMEHPHTYPPSVRAQVIVQNYICFVYLKDSLFERLQEKTPAGSIIKKCSEFLTKGRVRALRNAVAHSNWMYNPDYQGLIYYAKCKGNYNEMMQYEVGQDELAFWQSLARCVAYVAFTHIVELQK